MARLSPTGSHGHATGNRICFLTGGKEGQNCRVPCRKGHNPTLKVVWFPSGRLKKLFIIGTKRRIVKVVGISAPGSAQEASERTMEKIQKWKYRPNRWANNEWDRWDQAVTHIDRSLSFRIPCQSGTSFFAHSTQSMSSSSENVKQKFFEKRSHPSTLIWTSRAVKSRAIFFLGSGEIFPSSGPSRSTSWTEDSFEMRVLMEPFSETEMEGTLARSSIPRVAGDEAGPSHQRSVVENASLESSMRNRIARLEQDNSPYLLDKGRA
ncbi:hypothetical protein VNO78_07249 [Psophocarpus tetragonolobus]|uniref:Uncharacterized protein n=1 Tax=Psophocarpus tetragonolobus TaxID=3891 RepID=A0AAN9SSS9_PSOTE